MAPCVITALQYEQNWTLYGGIFSGEFGNASPTWSTLADWLQYRHVPGDLYHIRNRIAGAETWYDLLAHHVSMVWKVAVRRYGATNLYISAMCPTEKTLFQGEIRRSERYLDLTYTTVAKPMREALAAETCYADGIIALRLVQHYLCSRSYDWLQYLLEAYPGHVIEFTTLSVEWGTVPGFNTLFWEVRLY